MAKEWIVPEEDLGCDGAYFSYTEVVRCKDCKHKENLQKGTFGDILGYDGKCNIVRMFIRDNCYCVWGERSEDE